MIAAQTIRGSLLVRYPSRHARLFRRTNSHDIRHRSALQVFVVVLILVLGSPSTHGQQEKHPCVPLPADTTLRVDMKDVPLDRVVRLVSCSTETAFIFSAASLKQIKVTVFAPRPVGRNALMVLLDSVLIRHKLVRERRGPYQIISRAQPPSKRRSSKGR